MKSRVLTENQVRIASRVCTVLDGANDDDVLVALNSIIAATLVERSAEPGAAIGRATAFGLQLEKTVQAGLRGELTRNDQTPIDLRMVL
ncbi:hypothetical protein [Aquamicrobium sp.]|uniref:hypothetical protein n=1 Tax=Aquamicrobium sp. TaxID=1872579 RepID=UPI002586A7B4|nr:hypothetical protein [Aquamicrobium sp.]MCK9551589.1 hypothetical protein [Aquamicrobium sp.]